MTRISPGPVSSSQPTIWRVLIGDTDGEAGGPAREPERGENEPGLHRKADEPGAKGAGQKAVAGNRRKNQRAAGEQGTSPRESHQGPAPEDAIKAIRDATQFEWALGDVAFCKRVEAWTGRRADRLPMGRPRTHGGHKSRL